MTQFIDITKPRFRVIAAIPDDESIAEMRARFEADEAAPFPPSTPLLRSLPLPDGLRTRAEGARKPRQSPPDALKTAAQAAAKLGCSIKTLNAHVAAGDVRYVIIGKGTKRPHRMYAAADLNEFIANQTRKDVPCPSTRTETAARRISTSTSKCEVIGFTARRNARRGAKPKK